MTPTVSELELELTEELSCLFSVLLPRSNERTKLDKRMVQLIHDIFENHWPESHLRDIYPSVID